MTDFCCSEPEQRVSWNFYRGAHATLILSVSICCVLAEFAPKVTDVPTPKVVAFI